MDSRNPSAIWPARFYFALRKKGTVRVILLRDTEGGWFRIKPISSNRSSGGRRKCSAYPGRMILMSSFSAFIAAV